MLKHVIRQKSSIRATRFYNGESLETKLDRASRNNEPIKDSCEMIYEESRDLIPPNYDIRTDRFDVALHGHNIIEMSKAAASKMSADSTKKSAESVQGTEGGDAA